MVHDTSDSRTAFPCNTCSLSFEESMIQRNHMRSAWHVHNLQRKISGLPAQSEAEFKECAAYTSKKKTKSRHTDNNVDVSLIDTDTEASIKLDGYTSETLDFNVQDEEQSDHSSKQTDTSFSPIKDSTRCLFCAFTSPNIHENILHMSSAHSFFLPSVSSFPAAVEPLLSYLSLLIYTYHECIYCAREKNSVQGVQSHMRDKGHCKLDVSLYEDFFSSGEDVDTQDEEDNTIGTEIDEAGQDDEHTQEKTRHSTSPHADGTKRPSPRKTRKEKTQCVKPYLSHPRSRTSLPHQQAAALNNTSLQAATPQDSSLTLSSLSPHLPPLPSPPTPSNGRNSALSLAGLSNTQLVSLASLDKKMRRQQVSAQNRVGHLALRQPVKAIYYKTENPVYQAG